SIIDAASRVSNQVLRYRPDGHGASPALRLHMLGGAHDDRDHRRPHSAHEEPKIALRHLGHHGMTRSAARHRGESLSGTTLLCLPSTSAVICAPHASSACRLSASYKALL